MTVKSNDVPKNSESTADVNENTDRKDKLKVLKEMWEAAKKKKEESLKAETQKPEPTENDNGK